MGGWPKINRGFTLKTCTGLYDLHARVLRVGKTDWLVCIWGGQRPHIGAVAMAMPRPSLKDPTKWSSTVSVFTYPGHKEDQLVKEAAQSLSAALRGNVVVCAGAHWEDLSPEGIQKVIENCRALVLLILERLGSSPDCRVLP